MPSSIELPPPPDISKTLRYFRTRGMFCDVRLRLTSSPGGAGSGTSPGGAGSGAPTFGEVAASSSASEMEFLAHRVVLAASSPFFADARRDRVVEEIKMPPDMSVDAMRFLLCWMYNDPCKIESSHDRFNLDFLEQLRVGANVLAIPDLERFVADLLQHLKSEVKAAVATIGEEHDDVVVAIKEEMDEEEEDEEEEGRRRKRRRDNLRSSGLVVGTDGTLLDDDDDDDGGIDNGGGDEDNGCSGGLLDVVPFEGDRSIGGRSALSIQSSEEASGEKKIKKNDRQTVSTFPCEKCGRKVRRGDLERHHAFFHSDLNDRASIDQMLRPEKDDPVLSRHLSDDSNHFQCTLCDFSLTLSPAAAAAADKEADSPLSPSSSTSVAASSSASSSSAASSATVFRKNCAKHLYTRHHVICPTFCFPCPKPDCDTVMWSRGSLACHLRKQHGPPKAPRKPCQLCGAILAETSLSQHVLLVHGEAQKIPCPSCDKVFRNAYYLKCHQRVHAPATEKEFRCDDCDFEADDRARFRHHVWSRHEKNFDEGKMFSCPSCDYKTPIESVMKSHIKDKHLRTDNVPCPLCDKIFRTKKLMELHSKRIHGEGDGRKCDICGADFKSKSGYDYHLWRVHKQGKNGSVKDDKNYRLERPYKCAYCSHTSGLSGNMRKHLMNVHKGMPIDYVDLRTVITDESPFDNLVIDEIGQ